MKVTPREKRIIERFNNSMIEVEPNKHGKRPSDAELATMSDAQVLAGDWLVDIEDSTFWNRWDDANANLTLEVNTAVAEGRASRYTPVKNETLGEMYTRQERELRELGEDIAKGLVAGLREVAKKSNIVVGDPKVTTGYIRERKHPKSK